MGTVKRNRGVFNVSDLEAIRDMSRGHLGFLHDNVCHESWRQEQIHGNASKTESRWEGAEAAEKIRLPYHPGWKREGRGRKKRKAKDPACIIQVLNMMHTITVLATPTIEYSINPLIIVSDSTSRQTALRKTHPLFQRKG